MFTMIYTKPAKSRQKIRLLLIEDNQIRRDGIARMLKGQKDITVVAASGDGESTMLRIHDVKPNVILLYLGLRSQNCLHLVELVKKEFPKADVIVIDLAPAQGDVLQFVRAGASGFILKDASMESFVATIRSVACGEKVLPPVLNGSLFSQIIQHAASGGRANLGKEVRMTRREREVIALLSDGLSNKQIGQRLHIATYTIKSHIHNIMEKLALHTRLGVANYAYATDAGAEERADSVPIFQH